MKTLIDKSISHKGLGSSATNFKALSRHAFTLMELLVTIAIIALLAGLFIPVLSRAKAASRNTVCLSNLKQWGLTWTLYADDYNGKFTQNLNVPWMRGAWLLTASNLISSNSLLYLCPEATRRRRINGEDVDYGGPHESYLHANGQRSSYGLNLWMYELPPGVDQIQNRPRELHWGSFARISEPSRVPLFLDSMWRGGGPFDTDTPPQVNGEWLGFNAEMHHFAIDRHNGFLNSGFADGSVSKLRVKALWRQKWHRDFNTDASANWKWPEWMR